MSDPTATLALLLDAPLQSWGDSSRFNHRGTASFPSKSGVLGLIAAALGIDKYSPGEAERLAPLASLRFHVARLPRISPWGKTRPSLRLRDYHTIGAAYDRNDSWQSGMILRNAEGKLKSVAGNPEQSHTEVTEREYLLDSRFAVILQGETSPLEAIELALENPRWGVWLGRKSCPPALPLRAFLATSREEAFAGIIEILRRHEARRGGLPLSSETARWHDFDRIEEIADGSHDQLLPDQPLRFGDRSHSPRPVRHHRPVPPPSDS